MMVGVVLDNGDSSSRHSSGSKKIGSYAFILVLYQYLQNFGPSEAYIVPLLTREKHFTSEEVVVDIFPLGVYATLFFTLLAAPACHYFSYKTVIIVGALNKLLTFVIIYWGESLIAMQLSQICYGLGVASNFVFASYIFVLFDEEDYQRMTSYTQASSLISYLMAAELGQILVDRGASIMFLLQITVIAMLLTSVVSFFVPNDPSGSEWSDAVNLERGTLQGVIQTITETWRGRSLRLLSFWWVFATAGFSMTVNYATNLFDDIDRTNNTYGHIIAISQGAGSLCVLSGMRLEPLVARSGGTSYIVVTLVAGFLCALMSYTRSLWMAYVKYVIFYGISQLFTCLIYAQSAKTLTNREYSLLFSLNSLASQIIQVVLQGIVEFFQLSIKDMFYMYGEYFISLAIVFGILCYVNFLKTGRIALVYSHNKHPTLT